MRSMLTLAIAGLIAATALAPASAAPKHKRAAPAQSEYAPDGWQQAPVAARPELPGVVYQQPGACFTDEGYGRYTPCDVGGGS
jgi:hypothetical protein